MMNDDTKKNEDLVDDFEDEEFDDLDMEDYSDDDFGDEEFDDAGEDWDEGFESEFDDEFDDGEYEASDAPAKKSSKTNLIIIAGGIVLGLIVLVFMMGGGDNNQNQTQQAQNQAPATNQASTTQQQAAATPAQDAGPPQPRAPTSQRDIIYGRTGQFQQDETKSIDNPTGGMLHDDEVLENVRNEIDDVEFGDEVIQSSDNAPLVIDTPNWDDETEQVQDNTSPSGRFTLESVDSNDEVLTPELNLGLGDTTSNNDFEDFSDLPNPAVMEETETNTPAAPEVNDDQFFTQNNDTASEELATQTTNVVEPASNNPNLNKKLDLLFARLDQVESKLDKLDDNTGSSAEVSDLKDSIRSLEKKVAKLSTAPKATKSAPKKTSQAPAKKPAKAVSASKNTVNTKWVLRAAQNGSAMVSKEGRNEIRDIKIGDQLAGIGRITDIGQVNGKWVVQGTTGQIHQ